MASPLPPIRLPSPAWADTFESSTVHVPVEPGKRIVADLVVPKDARGIVIFAHGSGSGRRSPRNRSVADHLHGARVATLLLDLLTFEEAREDEGTLELRFDIRLLTGRLLYAMEWARSEPAARSLPLGLYGASTGGAAALQAAAAESARVAALVLRGARTDMVPPEALAKVRAPALLIVGGSDPAIVEVNRKSLLELPPSSQLSVVPGASHLFEEPGALEEVVRRTRDWFVRYLRPGPVRPLEARPTLADRSTPASAAR